MNATPAQKQVDKALVNILLSQPFYAHLAGKLQIGPDPGVKTAATNGKDLRFNPQFIEGLSPEETRGVIAHEVEHVARLHPFRRGSRDPETWNIATDYEINGSLLDAGFTLPSGHLYDPRFKDMPAERIYTALKDEQGPPAPAPSAPPEDTPGQPEPGDGPLAPGPGDPDPNGQPGDGPGTPTPDPGNCGAVEDYPADSPADMAQAQQTAIVNTIQAAQAAKNCGNVPAHIARLIEELKAPVIDWKSALMEFVDRQARNDYSLERPNPRFTHTGLYIPSLRNKELGEIAAIIDTSGSVYQKELDQFAGEIQEILNQYDASLTVIYVDEEVNGDPEIFTRNDTVKLEARGGGGTDFRPGFAYIEAHALDPVVILYFTDMECSSYPETPPPCPVLWLATWPPDTPPPFGEVIMVKMD